MQNCDYNTIVHSMTPIEKISLWIGLAPEKLVNPIELRLPYNTTTDIDCEKLIEICKLDSLTSLNVSMCAISDIALIRIANFCPQLEKFDASFCEKISYIGIKEITTKCKNLQLLAIGGCKQISEEDLKNIPWENTQIKSLDIGYCEKMTPPGIQNIVDRCLHLHSLDLAGLPINDQELSPLLKSRSFSEINLSYCKNITQSAISNMKNEYPKIKIRYTSNNKSNNKLNDQYSCTIL